MTIFPPETFSVFQKINFENEKNETKTYLKSLSWWYQMSIIIKLRTFAQKMTIVDQSLHRKYETLKFDFANENKILVFGTEILVFGASKKKL